MAANALPGVLHAIAQRRPTAHFRAGDDTAELKDPTAAARSSISSCQIPLLNLSLLAGCSLMHYYSSCADALCTISTF